jgi:hypothetical protein
MADERSRFGRFDHRTLVGALVIGTVAVFGGFALSASPAEAPSTSLAPTRKCVGVFVTGERRNVAADAKSLTVVGEVPCADRGVMAWSMQGVYRAFDDGSVEFLAAPVPPCPEGDSYVWIRYPNPTPKD